MKKSLLILFILSSFNSKGTIHQIGVWGGYYQFVPASITIQLGDTIQWEPYFGMLPAMLHTITSDNIPVGAVSFDQVWQMPSDTFFQYIPQVAGLYQYVCTPHIPNGMIGEFTVTNLGNTQTYVPDDNFESYLEANGMGNGIPNDEYVTTANIDTITSLDVANLNISDLTGIEDFTALSTLHCGYNQLASLDVSNNTALTLLQCNNNQLISLDLSDNTALTRLECVFNQLTSLNVSYNINLDHLDCYNNQLASLDVSNNTALIHFHCGYNQLTSMDMSQNIALTSLLCTQNQLISIDLSANIALEALLCNNNQLTSLDLRNGNNTNLSYYVFSSTDNPNLNCIDVDDASWSTANWTIVNNNIDQQQYFSANCNPSAIKEHTTTKELLKVTDLLGRETKGTKNEPLLYIYDDGTVEKRINIE